MANVKEMPPNFNQVQEADRVQTQPDITNAQEISASNAQSVFREELVKVNSAVCVRMLVCVRMN